MNRRSFLAGASSLSVASAGCLGGSSEWEMKHRANGINNKPLFDENDRWNDSPFTAEVFTDPDDARSELHIDEERLPVYEDLLAFDPDSEILTAFATSLRVVQPGRHPIWCPAITVDDEQATFELPIGDWPEELEPPRENWFVLARWEGNGTDPPAYAHVEVVHPDIDSGERTCLE